MKIAVTKRVTFDCAHMLTGHNGLCKNLHGHTYHVDVTVQRDSDRDPTIVDGSSEGMVVDFKDLKQIMQDCIVEPYDHALILDDSQQAGAEHDLMEVALKYNLKRVMFGDRPTAENMALAFLENLIDAAHGRGLKLRIVSVRVWETETSYAEAFAR